MPIDIEEFEAAADEDLQEGAPPLRQAVLDFLAYNPEMAYTRAELQSSLEVDAIHLLHQLSRLEREGLVRHKGRYWAIADGYDPDADEGD